MSTFTTVPLGRFSFPKVSPIKLFFKPMVLLTDLSTWEPQICQTKMAVGGRLKLVGFCWNLHRLLRSVRSTIGLKKSLIGETFGKMNHPREGAYYIKFLLVYFAKPPLLFLILNISQPVGLFQSFNLYYFAGDSRWAEMPRRRRKQADCLRPSLTFLESPVNVQRSPPSPVFCSDNPATAKVVPVEDLPEWEWVRLVHYVSQDALIGWYIKNGWSCIFKLFLN